MIRKLQAVRIGLLLTAIIFMPFAFTVAQSTVTVAQQAEEGTLDPNMLISGTGLNIIMNMFDTLFTRDSDGSLVPSLALSAEPIEDTVWEFKLREGVTFHNGEPFGAQAVKATLERVMDPDSRSPQSVYVGSIREIEVLDEYTIRVHTRGPNPILVEQLLMVPISPVKYLEEHGIEHFARNPVGTGPFRFSSWTRGEQVVLEAYGDHWRGRPEIDRVVFRVIPEVSSLIAALQTGEVDIIVNLPPDQALALANQSGINILEAESQRTIAIALPTEKEPYDSRLVRQALNYAVNVDEIIEFLFQGFARRVPTFHAPMYFGYNEDLTPYPHDPDRARALLAEAGYPNGFSGVLLSPNGRYPKDLEVSQAIAAQLREVGVDLRVQALEWGVMIARYNAADLNDPFLLGYGTPIWDSGAGFLSRMHSGSYSSYYRNTEVDALIDQALTTVDRDARGELYRKINEIIYDDPSHIFLYQQVDLYGVRDRVEWIPSSDERVWLFGARVR